MGNLATIIMCLKVSTCGGHLFDDIGVNATSVHKHVFCCKFFLMLWMKLPKPHEIGGFKVVLFELDATVFLVLPPEKST